jgi:hypothetical protein
VIEIPIVFSSIILQDVKSKRSLLFNLICIGKISLRIFKCLKRKILSLKEKTELVILPEMFNTGFSMNPVQLAEQMEGKNRAVDEADCQTEKHHSYRKSDH